jgi:hypothetical protein
MGEYAARSSPGSTIPDEIPKILRRGEIYG